MALYRAVGNLNRIALGDLAADVEFYTADKDADGVITLSPVKVIDGSTKRPAVASETLVDSDGATVWDDDVNP